jgi:hypothetical protein
MPHAANWIYGSTDGNFDRSVVPVGTVSEDVYSRKVLYLSYTPREDDNPPNPSRPGLGSVDFRRVHRLNVPPAYGGAA